MKKAFKITKKILNVVVTILLLAFIVVVLLQRISNNQVSIFKYRMFSVISGSMMPKYDVGDVLISKEVPPSSIKIGDPISYQGKEGSFKGKVVTHEVTNVMQASDGKYYFSAKGLANIIEDPIVSEDQLYGKIIYRSLVLSFIYKVISNKIGFLLFCIIPTFYIVGAQILTSLLAKEEKRRNAV